MRSKVRTNSVNFLSMQKMTESYHFSQVSPITYGGGGGAFWPGLSDYLSKF